MINKNINKENKMTKKRKEIPIFFAVDDNFVPFLGVTLQSLIENASKEYHYAIKVLHTGVCAENMGKIKKFERENVDVKFVDVSAYIANVGQKLHLTNSNYTKTTYYRLFIANLFPQYKKALYLDADIIVRGDISKLYNTNIFNNLVGAATDDFVQLTPKIHNYMYKCLGLSSIKKYFNAGILVLNLEQFRRQHFEEQFIDLLQKYSFPVQDQDYLNVICKDKVWYISNDWNRMPVTGINCDPKRVKLVHFNLRWKPWRFDNIPFGEEFWQYAKQTEFYDVIKNIKDNYTAEDQQREIANIDAFMEVIRQDGENPNNYYNLYVKPQQDDSDGEEDFVFDKIPAGV